MSDDAPEDPAAAAIAIAKKKLEDGKITQEEFEQMRSMHTKMKLSGVAQPQSLAVPAGEGPSAADRATVFGFGDDFTADADKHKSGIRAAIPGGQTEFLKGAMEALKELDGK
eukprot:m.326262 g.326262  ORF g.326262 m.326262 type:complete len:112 (+) comp19741_c1_seq1:206-541(+)